jgi:hypothetical protein
MEAFHNTNTASHVRWAPTFSEIADCREPRHAGEAEAPHSHRAHMALWVLALLCNSVLYNLEVSTTWFILSCVLWGLHWNNSTPGRDLVAGTRIPWSLTLSYVMPGAGSVAQVVEHLPSKWQVWGPEFKPQYWKKKNASSHMWCLGAQPIPTMGSSPPRLSTAWLASSWLGGMGSRVNIPRGAGTAHFTFYNLNS